VAVAAVVIGILRFFPGGPAPLEATLEAPVEQLSLAPTPQVALTYQGAGRLGGDERAPVVEWDAGRLSVEVEHGQGIDLAVLTREAEVRVVGTGFVVNRDALGTSVTVVHGRVAVLCASGDKSILDAGEQRVCPPTEPPALLGRARALQDAGADAAEVLQAADAGLTAGAEGAIRGELLVLRADALVHTGRHQEAFDLALSAMEAAPSRRLDLHHIAAASALRVGGCAAALPHLAVLRQEGATGPELVHYADCVDDPAVARDALTAALRLGAPPEQEAAIVERLSRLKVPR
jgi:hypothetical protein